ncbi:5'-nucleotidase C-terminal domain-containing protein [Isoptericola croceus]|uniref:5'-nucleotidase C-terminal domain-containing protein n=1 Tax=Isoptericola croceus TaxID=3031406 RepID=UPI0023F988EE|nr:5'-nucleotidase C-terminal domain-containing protein [Isoptericola croceus]
MQTVRQRVAGVTTLGLALAGVVTVGAAPAQAADPVDIQILQTNDFHGRLLEDAFGGSAGAAVLAGAVKELRAENPNTIFASAGDVIGASTFESFIQQDKPTIDALNAAGLDVSAVGNHELDGGYDDLTNRVMAEYDAEDNPYGGAQWQYIAANIIDSETGEHATPPSWVTEVGGVEVGFVGALTEDMPSLVSPDGIAGLEFTDITQAVNDEADVLREQGVDLVVALIHEGAVTDDCAQITEGSFGEVVTGLDGDVDAIVTGHTHLEYDCRVPVADWADRAVTERPVVSGGDYGVNLNQLVFSMDPESGEVLGLETDVLPLLGNYPADPEVAQIVADAVEVADELGAAPLGEIAGAFNRAQLTATDSQGNPVRAENRGGESTLGNLVAEVQRWATRTEEAGSAQIAFMNPGGLRADLAGAAGADFPRTVTYKQAAAVQPFANTLVNMQLTGEQVKVVLEQQWQRDAEGNVPSRPFLRLGVSEGFTYTYDPSRTDGDRVTGMWLDGEAIDAGASYSVTVNSFLASGGDNFRIFTEGSAARDTGRIDLSAFVDYMAEHAGESPLEVDASQRAVGVSFSKNEELTAGKKTAFDVSSWSMSTAADVTDDELVVALDGEEIGRFAVDSTVGSDPYDETGAAMVELKLPKEAGTLTLVGESTGTEIVVGEVRAQGGKPDWTSGAVYTTGDQVTFEGAVYEAMWWTQETPGASPWGSWQEIAETDGGVAVWTSSRVFTAGDVVEHDGSRYEAQWWTRNQAPGASPWGPWTLQP